MEIKNWLKDKYWLWGVLFGVVLILFLNPAIYIAFYLLGGRTFLLREFISSFLPPLYILWDRFFIFVMIFCAISFEIIFRSLNWYKKSPVNTTSRLIFLSIFTISVILFSGIIISGFTILVIGSG